MQHHNYMQWQVLGPLVLNLLPVQRPFLGIAAANNLRIYGSDIRDAYAHSEKPIVDTYLAIDDANSGLYFKKYGKRLNKRWVLPVQHSLQGHPESGKMWMRLIDKVLIKELGFASTVHDRCIYRKVINGKLVIIKTSG